jgi:hypothetical protein
MNYLNLLPPKAEIALFISRAQLIQESPSIQRIPCRKPPQIRILPIPVFCALDAPGISTPGESHSSRYSMHFGG